MFHEVRQPQVRTRIKNIWQIHISILNILHLIKFVALLFINLNY